MRIKEVFLTAVGTFGALFVKLFGGRNGSIITLADFGLFLKTPASNMPLM